MLASSVVGLSLSRCPPAGFYWGSSWRARARTSMRELSAVEDCSAQVMAAASSSALMPVSANIFGGLDERGPGVGGGFSGGIDGDRGGGWVQADRGD